MPALCASMMSPAKTPVICRCSLSVTLSRKLGPDAQGDVAHFLPERIALRDAEGGVRIADVFRAVIAHHGLQSRGARA